MGLHIDDILGTGNMANPYFNKFINALKKIFNFRTWEQNTEIEYCGAKIHRMNEHLYELLHTTYLSKQKPINFEEGPNDQLVTEKPRTMLRSIIGALQWLSTQSSPHVQAMTSQLARQMSRATIATLKEANKALRYAKQYADVGFRFQKLGKPEEMTFIIYNDAAFASRADLTSQGGHLVMMVHNSVTKSSEGGYRLIDWRSWNSHE